MSNIQVLDEKTAGQIAAGEVIERPAGVLKELLENAIDAGASTVHITLEGGGKTLIRINDNGCGMSAEDLRLSVLRHATSKIRSFEDLSSLHTFGFRGEALYSVAAVSRMTITSCQPGAGGNRLVLEGGQVVAESPAPAVAGTTLEIRDLFFNVPARLKFLKSDAYERACLLKVIEESALANLTVGYHVTVNGRSVYDLPAENGPFLAAVRARAKHILGPEVAESLVCKEFEELGLKLFISPADKLVTVRDYQYTFVNRRPIDSKTVQQAIYKAYQNARPKDRYPAFLAYMTLNPGDFDVNIHPQKRDIRFADEHRVFNFLMHAAGDTIFSNGRAVEAQVPSLTTADPFARVSLPPQAQAAASQLFAGEEKQSVSAPAVEPVTEKASVTCAETKTPMQIFAEKYGYLAKKVAKSPLPLPVQTDFTSTVTELNDRADFAPVTLPPAPDSVTQEPQLPATAPHWYQGPYHYLGQLQKSYLLFENPQGLVLIDQHAAQERVLFEHYLDLFEKHAIQKQPLLFPIYVDLMPSQVETLLSWADVLKEAGFEVERFAARTVLVRTMPHVIRFSEDNMKAFIVSFSQVTEDPSKTTDSLKRKMIALLACKRAIKAHDEISAAEADALLENMKNCKDGMHCPHGRPVLAQLEIGKIDKLFGR